MATSRVLTIILAFMGALMQANPAAAAVIFGRTFQLNNVWDFTDSSLQLTSTDILNYRATAYVTTPLVLEPTTSLEVRFSFVILGGTNGADGFTFTLQDPARGLGFVGAEGGNLGFYTVRGPDGNPIPSGLAIAIAFDDFRNADYGDADDNHIATLMNSTYQLRHQAPAPVDLNSGDQYWAWVSYDGGAKILSVYINNTEIKPANPLLQDSMDLYAMLGSEVYQGFTAATGGLADAPIITSFVSSTSGSVPEPQTCALFGAGLLMMALGLRYRKVSVVAV